MCVSKRHSIQRNDALFIEKWLNRVLFVAICLIYIFIEIQMSFVG